MKNPHETSRSQTSTVVELQPAVRGASFWACRWTMRTLLLVLLFTFTLRPSAAPAPTRPLEQVRSTADKIIKILSAPEMQGDAKRAERHKLIREELEGRFDWDAICRSCLGRHWSKITPDQRKEFVELFKQFLERTYLDRIEPYYNQLDRIEYQGERIVEGKFASVKTVITTTQKVQHPVEYRLEKSAAGAWQVYDVIIEGVSLVKNYRTQFDEIIARETFKGLLGHLKSKIAEQQAKPL